MSIRMLALDLDGTTLRKDSTVSRRTAAALRRAAQAGVAVTLATGRLHGSALLFARKLGLHAPLISAAGGLIRDRTGKTWLHRPIPRSVIEAAPAIARASGAQVELYVGDTLYVSDLARKRWELYHPRRLKKVSSWAGLLGIAEAVLEYKVKPMSAWSPAEGMPEKLYMTDDDPARLEAALHELKIRVSDPVEVTNSEKNNLEVTAAGATKGSAIAWLAEHLDLGLDQIMVAGDSLNDLSMFELECFKVAMGNAHPTIKAMASWVTASHMEDGVALAVERHLLGEVPA